jgi:ribosomal protein S5
MSSDLKKINKKFSVSKNQEKLVERLIKISRVSKVTKGGKVKFSSNCSCWRRKWTSWGVEKADDVVNALKKLKPMEEKYY